MIYSPTPNEETKKTLLKIALDRGNHVSPIHNPLTPGGFRVFMGRAEYWYVDDINSSRLVYIKYESPNVN